MNLSKKVMATLKKISLMLVAMTAVAGSTFAEERNKFTIEETIKDMKPASFSCDAKIDGSVLTMLSAGTLEPDIACSLSAEKLSAMLEVEKDVVLVDTRKSIDFSSFSIPSAINLSVSAVKNKPFLKQKTIVLIGDGKSEKAQYISCAKLKKDHFTNVKVLKGGMLSWVTKRLPINGKANIYQIGQLSPLEFWAESKFSENLIVVESAKKEFQRDVKNALLVDTVTATALKQGVRKWQKAQKKTFISALVVVSAERLTNQQYTELREEVFPMPVLVYSGTYKEYKAQLKLHDAVMLAKQKGPKNPGCHL